MKLNEQHKRILRHTLGIEKDGDDAWRNYYEARDGHEQLPELKRLVASGHLVLRKDNRDGSGYLFRATEKSREAVSGGVRDMEPMGRTTTD